MRGTLGFAAVLLLSFVVSYSITRAADDATPKHSIKEVMKIAHKEKLLNKVASGQASPEEKKQLLELYQSLSVNKPPKGEEADFKQRAQGMIVAVQAVIDGKDGAGDSLTKTVNCQECHKSHK